MKKPKTRVRLSLYERGIVEALGKEYGYAAGEARELVADYIAVVRRLGGYEPCNHYASLLDRAKREGYSPAAWLQHIAEVERGEAKDRGIGAEELRYLRML